MCAPTKASLPLKGQRMLGPPSPLASVTRPWDPTPLLAKGVLRPLDALWARITS